MFFLRNLSSIDVAPGKPWEFTAIDRVPPNALGKDGKKARTEWATNPKTDFHCYSMFEGVNPNLRIRAPGKDKNEEGNPARGQRGLPVDYDFPLTEPEIAAGIERMPPDLRPSWRETTLSGHCRLVWLFAFPINHPSHEFAIQFLKSLDKILPFRNLAGIDEAALIAPEKYYTNGCRWERINPHPVPHALLMGHFIDVSNKFDWKGDKDGTLIPLDIVAEQLKAKFPRFADWPGDFVEGAQGPSFWIDGSESPKSAIVRLTGIQSLAAHRSKPFYYWSDLIGAEFCNRYKIEQIGKSSEGIFYDEKQYFSKNTEGVWCADPKENIIGLLKTERGLSDTKRKGENTSEVERALVHIQRRNRVRVAAPFAFYPSGRIHVLGEPVLNTHTRITMQPAERPGEFPFLDKFIRTLWDPAEQYEYFMSWLSYFYKSCQSRTPRSGHALYVAGGPSVGKTFLNRAVIGGLVGGFAEAQQYLLGEDNFNGELFDYALWCVDDGSVSSSYAAHKKMSEMVKRIVANPSIRRRDLYTKGATVSCHARQVFTLNLDAESIRLLPDFDLSLRGKVSVLRTHAFPQVEFLPSDEMSALLARELPYLARFLMDWEIPPQCKATDPRFGVANYLEKSLVDTANQNSVSGAFSEILDEWQALYFTQYEPTADKWEGTSLQLYKSIMQDHTLVEAMRPFNLQSIGRMLVSLANKHVFDISLSGETERRIFTIPRNLNRFPKAKSIIVPDTNGGKFTK
jgi:hypothetical protein